MMTSRLSGSSDHPPKPSVAFGMLHDGIKKWAWKQGWQRLRGIQEEAILAILGNSSADLVITAPTAGGKTEAVYMPILSEIGTSEQEVGFQVLYLSPLRALIDDQYERISEMASQVDVAVARWHGDVARSDKARTQRSPAGVLMTTPESLEAFFVLRSGSMQRLFGTLKYIIVDELHAFMPSERGRQLQSQLNRLDILTGSTPRRIALSATIGDIQRACDFLRPPTNENAVHVSSPDSSELLIALHAFVGNDSDKVNLFARAEDMPDLLFRKLRGSNNLAFVNTRQGVEVISDKLRRMSEVQSLPNEFHPHHGSLAKGLRRFAEAQLKKDGRPATVICTSTLELGIDVGQIGSIAQVGSAPSVSSIAQRLGRSGRRGNASVLRYFVTSDIPGPDSHLEDHLHLELIQTIAQTELLLERWCESPSTGEKHFSTLLHQILSVICERGGLVAHLAWKTLCSDGPFGNVTKEEFVMLLRQMGAQKLIEQAPSGLLILGEEGERLQSRRDFYAVFYTPEEYSLISPEGPLGTLPIRFPLIPGHHLIFGGTRWLIANVDEHRRVVMLHPSPAGKVPKFAGSGWLVGDEVRKRMVRVLLGKDMPAYLDPTAQHLLRGAREAFDEAGLASADIITWEGHTCLFCWRGDRIRLTLRALLSRTGLRLTALGVAMSTASSKQDLINALASISTGTAPSAVELASEVPNKEFAKYDSYLGDEILSIDYANRVFRLQEAIEYGSQLLSLRGQQGA
ncbi:DEAD/DEAH box helicase [Candidatus Bipolaricaulota bacterium]